MVELIKKRHWENLHKESDKEKLQKEIKNNGFLKNLFKKLFSNDLLSYVNAYADYLLWDIYFKKYVQKEKGSKILEVGSAPGEYLVAVHKKFGYIPYGIDYSASGIKRNIKTFLNNNLDSNNIIHSDFFHEDFQKKHKETFDIVYSIGFIEHFINVKDVISKHLNLLKRGGFLCVAIPNLRGFNYILLKIFNKDLISKHNLSIMEKEKFIDLFKSNTLKVLFYGYYGVLNLGLFYRNTSDFKGKVLTILDYFQYILNIIFHLIFRKKGLESRLFSPYLLFIGVKNN